jgi:hypothetical protein
VRQKQSTVLAVVLWHCAGFDLLCELLDTNRHHMLNDAQAEGFGNMSIRC